MAALAPPARRTIGTLARRDSGVRVAAASSLWLALLLVTYWWVADGGVRAVATTADALTQGGRVSGLWASILLLAQVVLMARVPVLETAFGQDRLARIHRVVGFTSFWMMLAHIGLIAWGYDGGRLSASMGELWDLTLHSPGMLLADAGSIALVLVVVTSIRAARKRLRYESWHLLHLYGYLGAGLALPHQLWTGADFINHPRTTAFWWAAWVTVAITVRWYRVAVPILRTLHADLRVAGVVAEGPGVVSVHIRGRHMRQFEGASGAFMTWRFLGRRLWTRGNPYSLSAAPGSHGLRITAADAGDGSAALRHLRPGTRVAVEGPYGRLTERARTRDKVVFIGAGVGIAPLRALAESMSYRPGGAILLQRYRDAPLFAAEFEHLARVRGLTVHALGGPRRADGSWSGPITTDYDDATLLSAYVPDAAEHDLYICGPAPWVSAVVRAATAIGVPTDQIHTELFEW